MHGPAVTGLCLFRMMTEPDGVGPLAEYGQVAFLEKAERLFLGQAFARLGFLNDVTDSRQHISKKA